MRPSEPADPLPAPAALVIAAPPPLAANGYARARLLRQLYATGGLTPAPADTLNVAG